MSGVLNLGTLAMAPTVATEGEIRVGGSSPQSPANGTKGNSSRDPELRSHTRQSVRDPVDLHLSFDDYDNSCETYFGGRDTLPSVIPEPSPAFREAMDKLRLEQTNASTGQRRSCSGPSPQPPPSVTTSSSPSTYSKSRSSSSSNAPTSSPSSSYLSPISAECGSGKTSCSAKCASYRRPASFGGSDLIKPKTNRRASHCEKRVSWADERGSDHQLITVRLIRPRLAKEVRTGTHHTPGHSILRNAGVY